MKLVIVESPTKAKTIKKFLPEGFVVESSFGHVRDLPESATEIPKQYKKEKWARLGINIANNFQPLYIIPQKKKKQIAKLKELIADAEELYLATDEDREGEAISWHLVEVLKPTVPIHRLVFHEITNEAIQSALRQPRSIDMCLVSAQEARRLLDRLYGYEISPVLWRKIAPRLSAGRVQSAALHLIVERERERIRFIAATYWDITGEFKTQNGATFPAKLFGIDGKRVAAGKDFDGRTGKLNDKAARECVILDQHNVDALVDRLRESVWRVSDLQQKPLTLSPKPPFITSTLQQDAGRKFGWPANKTMRVAQRLYEEGHITYMRTDSVHLSDEAITAAREKILRLYGKEYMPPTARLYRTKSKTAQEAHEAIRPAGKLMRSVDKITNEVEPDEAKLYDLIWKRSIASQMSDAKLQQTVAKLQYEDVIFQATGRIVTFPGFLQAYVESEENGGENGTDMTLPHLRVNDTVFATKFLPLEHHTKPPARYTEASLIKELESDGIGRPSTYATIIDTILRRDYVYKDGSALIPRFVALAVDALLGNNFQNVVNTEYTANMEEDLDRIAEGKIESTPYLKSFYFGDQKGSGLHAMLQVDIDARLACTIPLGKDANGNAVNVRIGRYGPYVERVKGEQSDKASLPKDLAPDQLTLDKALVHLEKQMAGPLLLGTDPASGEKVYLLEGRFGPYVQLGEKAAKNGGKKPKMKGLLKGMDAATMTLETALQLLALPKTIGAHPTRGEPIVADAGRFGPYIRCGVETRSLTAEDHLFTLTLERAVELLNTPKARGRRGSVTLHNLGAHPTLNEPIEVRTGRFGPYLKCGKVNAAIPKGTDPASVSLDQAVALIEKKLNR